MEKERKRLKQVEGCIGKEERKREERVHGCGYQGKKGDVVEEKR